MKRRPDHAVNSGPGLDLDSDRHGGHDEPYPEETFTISGLTLAAKEIIEGAFPMMWVRGEVTDFKSHRNGHWYFCLRDSTAQVRAVIWSKDVQRIPATPDEGMQVLAYGRLTVYAARGEMQFTVSRSRANASRPMVCWHPIESVGCLPSRERSR